MKLKASFLLLPLTLGIALGFTPSCGGDDVGSGDGDGDESMGGAGDGDTTPGDGDLGDGDMGDGDLSSGGQGGGSGCTECPDDGNPCTEDVCNPDTGECGIPRTGNTCDDGIFCNGEDSCDAGECTVHAGDPCSVACNEGSDRCECEAVTDCPGGDLGGDEWGVQEEWEACTFRDACDTLGRREAVKTLYRCMAGECQSSLGIAREDCPRDTEGDSCDDGNFCNGEEVCGSGSCESGPAPSCEGATPECNSEAGSCVECNNNSHCDAEEVCQTNNTCSDDCMRSESGSHNCRVRYTCDAAPGNSGSCFMGCYVDQDCGPGVCSGATGPQNPGTCMMP